MYMKKTGLESEEISAASGWTCGFPALNFNLKL
jgi:hypothetical protein